MWLLLLPIFILYGELSSEKICRIGCEFNIINWELYMTKYRNNFVKITSSWEDDSRSDCPNIYASFTQLLHQLLHIYKIYKIYKLKH